MQSDSLSAPSIFVNDKKITLGVKQESMHSCSDDSVYEDDSDSESVSRGNISYRACSAPQLNGEVN